MSTFKHEKTKCGGLSLTKTKMQHWGENKMCDAKWIDRWPNNQP
jgi:hypothetical protein